MNMQMVGKWMFLGLPLMATACAMPWQQAETLSGEGKPTHNQAVSAMMGAEGFEPVEVEAPRSGDIPMPVDTTLVEQARQMQTDHFDTAMVVGEEDLDEIPEAMLNPAAGGAMLEPEKDRWYLRMEKSVKDSVKSMGETIDGWLE